MIPRTKFMKVNNGFSKKVTTVDNVFGYCKEQGDLRRRPGNVES